MTMLTILTMLTKLTILALWCNNLKQYQTICEKILESQGISRDLMKF